VLTLPFDMLWLFSNQLTGFLLGHLLLPCADTTASNIDTVRLELVRCPPKRAPPPPPAPAESLDYAWQSLDGHDFSGKKLDGANFTGAKLTGANFDSASLKGAMFDKAACDSTNLTGTGFSACDLSILAKRIKRISANVARNRRAGESPLDARWCGTLAGKVVAERPEEE
jgi:uncharacterized protein YjbI with pentapeptide repeats